MIMREVATQWVDQMCLFGLAGVHISRDPIAHQFRATVLILECFGIGNLGVLVKPGVPDGLVQNDRHTITQCLDFGCRGCRQDCAARGIECVVLRPQSGKKEGFIIWKMNVVRIFSSVPVFCNKANILGGRHIVAGRIIPSLCGCWDQTESFMILCPRILDGETSTHNVLRPLFLLIGFGSLILYTGGVPKAASSNL